MAVPYRPSGTDSTRLEHRRPKETAMKQGDHVKVIGRVETKLP
jgi:hypothetical protein